MLMIFNHDNEGEESEGNFPNWFISGWPLAAPPLDDESKHYTFVIFFRDKTKRCILNKNKL